MEYISIFLVSFIIAFTGALTPGPLLTLVVAKSLEYGRKAGPVIIGGHAALEIVIVCILVLGLGKIINSPAVVKTISTGGALILIFFGISIINSIPEVSFNISAERYGASATLFFQGITMSIANPYWTVWWLTVGLGLLITARDMGIKGLSFFFTGHILADLIWYSFVSYSIGKSKRIISQNIYRKILVVCGLILILFGLYFGIFTLCKGYYQNDLSNGAITL
ncbi:MAG: LysE family translocator [Candidatus Omnitrophica bacterium]|nr:LysE family translocator [Candidatus Omnitrophota bacterium]